VQLLKHAEDMLQGAFRDMALSVGSKADNIRRLVCLVDIVRVLHWLSVTLRVRVGVKANANVVARCKQPNILAKQSRARFEMRIRLLVR
jgi:hypothetical protein